MTSTLGERAVVIGGGIGGLFAAPAVAGHFDEVVVLDRDECADANPRKGVPQGRHFHILLPGGMDSMTEWFPGFADDLVTAGSIPMQIGRDFAIDTTAGRSYSMHSHRPEPFDGPTMFVQTRPVLEDRVRQRVRSFDYVDIQHRTFINRPLVNDGNVTGVATGDGQLSGTSMSK